MSERVLKNVLLLNNPTRWEPDDEDAELDQVLHPATGRLLEADPEPRFANYLGQAAWGSPSVNRGESPLGLPNDDIDEVDREFNRRVMTSLIGHPVSIHNRANVEPPLGLPSMNFGDEE